MAFLRKIFGTSCDFHKSAENYFWPVSCMRESSLEIYQDKTRQSSNRFIFKKILLKILIFVGEKIRMGKA